MVFKRQLLSGFPIRGEVGWESNGVDVGLQLHDVGGGEVAEEGEAAEHRWPRVLGAQGDEVGPWNVSRIGEVLQQGDDWLVEAWIAENLLSVGVDVVVYEVENCDKFPGLQGEILGGECGVVVTISPQEVEDASGLRNLEFFVAQGPGVLDHLDADLRASSTQPLVGGSGALHQALPPRCHLVNSLRRLIIQSRLAAQPV